MPLYPTRLYIGYQVAGAYMVLVASFIYMGFPHFRQVFRRAFTATQADDREELLPYRTRGLGTHHQYNSRDRMVLHCRTEFRFCSVRDNWFISALLLW